MGLLRRRTDAGVIEARIRDAVAGMRDMLGEHGAGVEVLSFDIATGVLVLRAEGDCRDCDMAVANLLQGIDAHLRMRVPEISEVRLASVRPDDG